MHSLPIIIKCESTIDVPIGHLWRLINCYGIIIIIIIIEVQAIDK